tara:strand:+ start:197 stop:505 length:309 start_codon:yes stop_codon:yes gene_type:complete
VIIGNEHDQQKTTKRPNWGQIQEKAEHGKQLKQNDPAMYREWLGAVKSMRDGGDCGQIEPWSPWSLRDTYYAGWADGDFGTLLSQVGEIDETWGQNAPENKE